MARAPAKESVTLDIPLAELDRIRGSGRVDPEETKTGLVRAVYRLGLEQLVPAGTARVQVVPPVASETAEAELGKILQPIEHRQEACSRRLEQLCAGQADVARDLAELVRRIDRFERFAGDAVELAVSRPPTPERGVFRRWAGWFRRR